MKQYIKRTKFGNRVVKWLKDGKSIDEIVELVGQMIGEETKK